MLISNPVALINVDLKKKIKVLSTRLEGGFTTETVAYYVEDKK